MFDEIGKKLKGIARTATILGIIASAIGGFLYISIVLDAADYEMPREMMSVLGVVAKGLGIVVGGSVAAWAASLLLYGIGQLIDNSDRMVELMEEANDLLYDGGAGANAPEASSVDNTTNGDDRTKQALRQLYQLYQNGSITDKDYEQKRKRLLEQYHQYNG